MMPSPLYAITRARRVPSGAAVLSILILLVLISGSAAASTWRSTTPLTARPALAATADRTGPPAAPTRARARSVSQRPRHVGPTPAGSVTVTFTVPERAVRPSIAAVPVPSRPTGEPALDAAIARLPLAARSVRWVLSDAYGSWGTADWYHGTVYLATSIPSNRLFDVVAHEWSHLLSVQVYGGDVAVAVQQMNRYFGGTGFAGSEDAADCMARQLGAKWTHYTACDNAAWKSGAARLLRGGVL